VTLPTWLFDELADRITDRRQLVALARAWAELLDGAEEVAPFDAARYHELCDLAHPAAGTFGKTQRTDFWPALVEPPAPDETYYLTPARAAEISGLSTQRLAAMRRRGALRSIGMTPTEYARAREAAGWTEGGWGPGVFYERASVEALASRNGKS
jgi:hypothetical protein